MGKFRSAATPKWPKAGWVEGEEQYATLALCSALTVELHQTLNAAQKAKAFNRQLRVREQLP